MRLSDSTSAVERYLSIWPCGVLDWRFSSLSGASKGRPNRLLSSTAAASRYRSSATGLALARSLAPELGNSRRSGMSSLRAAPC